MPTRASLVTGDTFTGTTPAASIMSGIIDIARTADTAGSGSSIGGGRSTAIGTVLTTCGGTWRGSPTILAVTGMVAASEEEGVADWRPGTTLGTRGAVASPRLIASIRWARGFASPIGRRAAR